LRYGCNPAVDGEAAQAFAQLTRHLSASSAPDDRNAEVSAA
jgi:hypothetical protein